MEPKPLSALIVEDCEDDATLLVRHLKRSGFDVCHRRVENAGEMRAALCGSPWDVVISDSSMPHFSGLEALEVLQDSRLDLPFVLVSGVAAEEAGIEAMRHGAHDYLIKGNLARLAPVVKRELHEAEVRRERRREEDWRKQAEAELQRTSEQCKLALQAARMGAWEWRVERGKLSFDERVGSLFSLPAGTEIDYRALLDRVHDDDRAAAETALKQAIAGGRDGVYRDDFRVVLPDGSMRWIGSFGQTFFEGENGDRRPVRLIGIHADITESKEAELRIAELNRNLDCQLQALQRALTQKTVLMQEVQHRVKNNLQIISSLLSLEAEQLEEGAVRKPLEESRDRVRAMALMHEEFCHSDDLSQIDCGSFVDKLASYFMSSYGIGASEIQFSADVSVKLSMNEAIPCGLIIQELLSNSIKHAFPEGTGRIRIEFHQLHGEFALRYRDSGAGLPENVSIREPKTLGLRLISDLVRQLRGRLAYHHRNGANFSIKFKSEEEQRPKAAAAG